MATARVRQLEHEYARPARGRGPARAPRPRPHRRDAAPTRPSSCRARSRTTSRRSSRATGCYAAMLNPKGRIVADMRILRARREELWLDTEADALEAVLRDLRMYKIGRQVEIADRTRRALDALADRARAARGRGRGAGRRALLPDRAEHSSWSPAPPADVCSWPHRRRASTCCWHARDRRRDARAALRRAGRRAGRRAEAAEIAAHRARPPALRRRHDARRTCPARPASSTARSASRRAATSARSRSPACTTAAIPNRHLRGLRAVGTGRAGHAAAAPASKRGRPRHLGGASPRARARSRSRSCGARSSPATRSPSAPERPAATVVELPFDADRWHLPGKCRIAARMRAAEGRPAVESRRATQTQRRRHLSSESPLLGGPLPAEAGAEEPRASAVAYDADADVYRLPGAGAPSRRSRRRCATSTGLLARARPGPPGRRLGPLGARLPARWSRCSTSTTGTGSGSRSRASRTSRRRAARCSPRTTPARCRRTRR